MKLLVFHSFLIFIFLVSHLSPAFAGSADPSPTPSPSPRRRRSFYTPPPKACDERAFEDNLCVWTPSHSEPCGLPTETSGCHTNHYVMSQPNELCVNLPQSCIPLNTNNGQSPDDNAYACSEAADVYGLKYEKASPDSGYPKGCYYYGPTKQFYYNEVSRGDPQALSAQVCLCDSNTGSSGYDNQNIDYGGNDGSYSSASKSVEDKPALIAGIVVCGALVVGVAGYLYEKDKGNKNINMADGSTQLLPQDDTGDTAYVLMEDQGSTKGHPRVVQGTPILEREVA